MNLQVQSIPILTDSRLKSLLSKLKLGTVQVDLVILLKNKGNRKKLSFISNEFIDNIRTELKKRGVRRVLFSVDTKEYIRLLECFVDLHPQSLHCYIPNYCEELNEVSCANIIRIIKRIGPKALTFHMFLRNLTKSFLTRFSKQVEGIKSDLNMLNVQVEHTNDLFEKGINSHEVLEKLSNFKNVWFSFQKKVDPTGFGFKLIYLKTYLVRLTLNAAYVFIAHQLILKNHCVECQVAFVEVAEIKPLLPLFISSSKKDKVTVTKPEQKMQKYELKTVLKYNQVFSYKSNHDEAKLPLRTEEVLFLEKHYKLIAYNYVS